MEWINEWISPSLLKSLHLVFVVTWFAGLFYIVRLFIYHVEAQEKSEPEKGILTRQYKIMERRLWYIITWPSMILTLILANWMLFKYYSSYISNSWMLLKLGFVGLLVGYHLGCQVIYNQLHRDKFRYNSIQLRLWNEVATLLLFVIVFLIVYKRLDFWKGIIGFLVLAVLLMLGIKGYKRVRKTDRKEEAKTPSHEEVNQEEEHPKTSDHL